MKKEMKSVRFQYRGFVYIGKYVRRKRLDAFNREPRHEIQFPCLNEKGFLCAKTFLITDKEFKRCNRD